VVFLVAGTLGGMPHNASATLAFIFPLGMMAALLRNDGTFLRNDHALAEAGVARSAGSL
jgi:hypothetical protein